VVDVTCARPAGQTFRIDGALYRPGQSSADRTAADRDRGASTS